MMRIPRRTARPPSCNALPPELCATRSLAASIRAICCSRLRGHPGSSTHTAVKPSHQTTRVLEQLDSGLCIGVRTRLAKTRSRCVQHGRRRRACRRTGARPGFRARRAVQRDPKRSHNAFGTHQRAIATSSVSRGASRARRSAISATIVRRVASLNGYASMSAVAARMATAGAAPAATRIDITAASL